MPSNIAKKMDLYNFMKQVPRIMSTSKKFSKSSPNELLTNKDRRPHAKNKILPTKKPISPLATGGEVNS